MRHGNSRVAPFALWGVRGSPRTSLALRSPFVEGPIMGCDCCCEYS